MALERVSASSVSEFEYVLIVDREVGNTEKRLLKNGNEVKKWKQIFHQGGKIQEEWEYEEERQISNRRYSQSGLLILEVIYDDGLPSDSIHYTYDSGRLIQVENFDAEGASRFRESYLYTKRGRLRDIVRRYPDGSVWTASYNFDTKGLAEERIRQDDDFYVGRYALNGVLDTWQVWNDGNMLEEKLWEYYPEGGEVQRIVQRIPGDGTTVEEYYNIQGSIVRRTVSGGSPEEVEYTRNDEGQLIEKTRISADGKESWIYTYDEEGEVRSEAYYRKASLEKIRYYTGDDQWFDELIRQDTVFLRVYYDKEEKIKEEIVQEGQVIRTRVYLD